MRDSGDRVNVPIKQADCALFHCGKNNLSHNRLQSDSTRCNSLIILIKMPPCCKPQRCHSRLLLWHFYDKLMDSLTYLPVYCVQCVLGWKPQLYGFYGFLFYFGFESKPVQDSFVESCSCSRWRTINESKSGWRVRGAASPCQKGSWEHLLAQEKSVPGQPEGAGPPGRRWAAEGGLWCRGPPGLWLCARGSSRCTGRQCWSYGNGGENRIKSDLKVFLELKTSNQRRNKITDIKKCN